MAAGKVAGYIQELIKRGYSPDVIKQKTGYAAPAVVALGAMGSSDESEAGVVGKAYPLAKKGTWWGDEDYLSRGGRIVEMSPDEYLDQVKPLNRSSDDTLENVDDLIDHVEQGRDLDPPAIYADGSEDGRHRALMAKKLGIKKIPVIDFRSAAPLTTGGLLGLASMNPQQARAASTGTIQAANSPGFQTAADYMEKLELPIVGKPLQGLSDWARGVAYGDDDKLKRAAVGALDIM